MPLQHQLLLFSQLQLKASALWPLGLGLTSAFSLCNWCFGVRASHHILGKVKASVVLLALIVEMYSNPLL